MNVTVWTVLGLSLLPAAGNFAGGLAAELVEASKPLLNRALHASAGVVVGVVAVELTPRALEATTGWVVGLAFLGGGVLYALIETVVDRFARQGSDDRRAWMIYVAVTADLLGDGVLIGAGTSVSFGLGLVLAIGQILADLPEGFAVLTNFKHKGLSRSKRLALSASFAIPVVLAALSSYFLLRGRGDAILMTTLMVTAGLLTVATVEDMIREAHEAAEDTKVATFAFAGGFALFAVVSASFGCGAGP